MERWEAIWEDVRRIREVNPLVLNVTNNVVTNTTANALLALGASPAMSHAPEDAEELAGRLLARGFQRVLSPMAAFRDPREARIFRMAFFEQYFRGHGAGGALRYAQRALLEAFGLHSGWFLYRIFGQAEDRTYSTQSSLRKGMDLSRIY